MYLNPIKSNSYNYQVCAFKAKEPVRISVLKNLKDVSCVYCGEKMLTFDQIDEFSSKAAKLSGKKLYKYLSSLEHYMKDNEKAVLLIIKEGIKKHPDCQIQGVLQYIFPRHLEKLENKQKTILKSIAKEAKNFPEADKNLTLMQVYKGLFEIKRRDEKRHFKLKAYINDFYKIKDLYTEPKNFEKISEIIGTMPTTYNNLDAFIVKYSRKSSKEIVERLLKTNQSTIEHLLPRSLGGTNDISNLVLACGKDNSRRGNKPLDTMPTLRKNLQRYFITLRAAMGKKVSVQDCVGVEKYIRNIQKTVNSLLSEPIRFDNSIDFRR